jgi:hypothetical protein
MMFAKLSRLLVLVLLMGASPAGAQVQAPEPKAAEHTVAQVVEWVRREGTEAIMSHDVAGIFGWGEDNVLVTRMAFTHPDSHVSYAFDVVRDRPNIVMLWRNPSEMIVWQMSDSGELLQTLHATRAGVAPVDNALYQPKWREALSIYFELVPPPPAGTGQ